MIPYDERHRMINTRSVTVNGNPAQLSGAMNDFATVTDRTTGLSAEWSWETVKRVIDHREGRF